MKYSAYFTTRNCVTMNYPFVESISSTFQFADEIIVCDTSDDNEGTKDKLSDLTKEFGEKFKVVTPDFVDWNAKNSGIYDGLTKAFARSHCTSDYLWQQDVDEVLEDDAKEKIDKLAKNLDSDSPLISTLVVEYWGSKDKVRIDVNSWKERLSLYSAKLTHGIPGPFKKYEAGLMFAHPGTDGCNIIHKGTELPANCLNFVTDKSENIRRLAITDSKYVPTYEAWYNKMGDRLPVIHHFSWWSVYEKMLKYKLFWNDSWQRLYNEKRPEGYNPFFDKPFSEVSDEEMRATAKKIEAETSGHIFHSAYQSGISPKTNGIFYSKKIPEIVKDWCERNKTK